jgi:hypothetical protein
MTQQNRYQYVSTATVHRSDPANLLEDDSLDEVYQRRKAEGERKSQVELPARIKAVIGVARIGRNMPVLIWDSTRALGRRYSRSTGESDHGC